MCGGRNMAQAEAMPLATTVLCFLVAEYRREVDELYKWAGLPYWQSSEGLGRSLDRYVGAAGRTTRCSS